jgi:hypothetical protein
MDFTTYPQELVRRLIRAPNPQQVCLTFYGAYEQNFVGTGDVVIYYDTSVEPVPNPNGTTLSISDSIPDQGRGVDPLGGDNANYYPAPRYETDEPYNFESLDPLTDNMSSLFPHAGDEFVFDGGAAPGLPLNWSVDFSVDNGDSKVVDVTDPDNHVVNYYPYAQETTTYNQTANFRPDYAGGAPNGSLCCPIKNAVIAGKASVWSVSGTTERYFYLFDEGEGPVAMKVTVDSDFAEEQVIDWSFTFDPDNPEPTSYEVPKIAGKITFINDWWIESITPPAE